MTSDVYTLNAYGRLVSALIQDNSSRENKDREQLTEVYSGLNEILGKAAGVHPAPPAATVTGSESDPAALLRSIDEIRLRMVGVLLGAGAGAFTADGAPMLDEEFSKPLVTGSSGLTWGIVGRSCVILMPPLDERIDTSRVATDLLSVYENAWKVESWVIDCSAIRRLPVMLIAVILGYKDGLGEIGKRLGFVWLAQSAIPPEMFDRVQKLFDLQRVGDFFFTQGLRK